MFFFFFFSAVPEGVAAYFPFDDGNIENAEVERVVSSNSRFS